ncbi:MAG: hypothetical protein V3U13_08495, partial [Gemmatimonadota bacterium]
MLVGEVPGSDPPLDRVGLAGDRLERREYPLPTVVIHHNRGDGRFEAAEPVEGVSRAAHCYQGRLRISTVPLG